MRPTYLPHRTGVAVAAVIGVAAALLAPVTPATAAITTTCTTYKGCAKEGKGSGGYARANHRMYWQMYSGHNCTNYVAFRMVRRGMPNRRPWSGPGNATHWGSEMPRRTDKRPAVASVAWWRAGSGPGGSTGHVAFVEKVTRSGIVVSQDSWGGTFSWARVSRGSGWPDGFIHLKDARLKGTRAPEIAGARRVGSRLTASKARWATRPASVSYRWQVGGRTLRHADTRSLRLERRMIGKRVQVRAVARRLGYPRSVVASQVTKRIARGRFSLEHSPALDGRPRVAHTIRVSGGSWSPRPDRVRYRWFVDGKRIRSVSTRKLRIPARFVRSRIAVTVTARRPGYAPMTRTLRTGSRVAPGRLHLSSGPRIRGVARRGETLRIRRGQTTRPAFERRVQWLRDGRPVKGADGRRYQLRRKDLGHRIRAQVSYRRSGYRPLTVVTAPTARVKRNR
jgi:surface antigen